MKFRTLLAIGALVVSPAEGLAQGATQKSAAPSTAHGPSTTAGATRSVCGEAALAIEDALKDSGYLKAQDVGDDSAPRATMRAARVTAHMAAIQANLTILVASHCALPKVPISADIYEGAGIECALARTESDVKSKCDRKTWQPGPRWLDPE